MVGPALTLRIATGAVDPKRHIAPRGEQPMQIDHLLKVDGHDGSVGLAFDPTHGGTHYRFVVFDNAEGVITRLDRLINDEWELVDEEPPFSLQVLVRHRLRGFA